MNATVKAKMFVVTVEGDSVTTSPQAMRLRVRTCPDVSLLLAFEWSFRKGSDCITQC